MNEGMKEERKGGRKEGGRNEFNNKPERKEKGITEGRN